MPEPTFPERGPIKVEGLPPREPLGDLEFGNLLAALGNSEVKAVTLTLMEPDQIYNQSGIHKTIIKAQGDTLGWDINNRTVFNYCKNSLAPIGLVAKEYIDPEVGVWGYEITPYGREIGLPLAGLLLDFSLAHPNLSLVKLFGLTQSPHGGSVGGNDSTNTSTEIKKRAPLARLKIFRDIAKKSKPFRAIDIANSTSIDPNLLRIHLRELRELGIISYETASSKHGTFAFYKYSPDAPSNNPPPYMRSAPFPLAVWEICQAHPDEWIDSQSLIKYFKEKLPNRVINKTLASQTLAHLARTGYVTVEKFHEAFMSEGSVTDEQRGSIEDIANLMELFQKLDPETLELGNLYAQSIRKDSVKVSELLRKAKESSPYFNSQSRETTSLEFKNILREHSDGLSIETLTKLYNQRVGRRLSQSRVQRIVVDLVKKEEVNGVISKGMYRIFPKNEDEIVDQLSS